MHPLGRSGATLAAIVALNASLEGHALAAPTKQECFASSQSGQDLQRAGKLQDARTQFLVCAAAGCPEMVRADCAQRVDEIRRAMPTIVFEARDAEGSDLSAVRVMVDGVSLLERLDGRSVAIEPGVHEFRFEAEGHARVEKSFVIREGEKERHERVVFSAPAPATSVPAPVPVRAPLQTQSGGPAAEAPGSSQRLAAYVVGGLGVVGIGVGSAFGLSASSKYNQARSDCGSGWSATSAAASEKTSADTAATAATVAFIAGGAALATGFVLLFTAPTGESRIGTRAARLTLVPSAGPSSGGVLLLGRF